MGNTVQRCSSRQQASNHILHLTLHRGVTLRMRRRKLTSLKYQTRTYSINQSHNLRLWYQRPLRHRYKYKDWYIQVESPYKFEVHSQNRLFNAGNKDQRAQTKSSRFTSGANIYTRARAHTHTYLLGYICLTCSHYFIENVV